MFFFLKLSLLCFGIIWKCVNLYMFKCVNNNKFLYEVVLFDVLKFIDKMIIFFRDDIKFVFFFYFFYIE